MPREKLRTTGYSGPMSPGDRVVPGAEMRGVNELKCRLEVKIYDETMTAFGTRQSFMDTRQAKTK